MLRVVPVSRIITNKLNSLLVICPVCAKQIERSSLSSHLPRCPKRKFPFILIGFLICFLACSIGCKQNVAPIDEQTHEAICEAKIVSCPASDVGCDFQDSRGRLSAHTSICSALRMRPILLRLQQLEISQQQQQQELRETQEELRQTNDQLR